jgi:hypothetical protein
MKLFKNKLSKGKTRLVLGLSIIVFFVAFGMTSKPVENKSSKDSTAQREETNQPSVAETKNQQEDTKEEVKEIIRLKMTLGETSSVKTDKTEISGNVSPVDSKVSLEGDKRLIKVDADGNFSIIVNLNEGENNFKIIAQKDNEKTEERNLKITRSLTAEEIRKKFKAAAKAIPYKELFRNIGNYEGAKVVYTGKVVQVIGDGNFGSTLKVDITRGSYGFWDDEILLNILDAEASKILGDDVIKFWGVVEGERTYQTVLGAQITVPEINAEIIELVR